MDKTTHDELELQELEEERKISKSLEELVRLLKAWLVPPKQRR